MSEGHPPGMRQSALGIGQWPGDESVHVRRYAPQRRALYASRSLFAVITFPETEYLRVAILAADSGTELAMLF